MLGVAAKPRFALRRVNERVVRLAALALRRFPPPQRFGHQGIGEHQPGFRHVPDR